MAEETQETPSRSLKRRVGALGCLLYGGIGAIAAAALSGSEGWGLRVTGGVIGGLFGIIVARSWLATFVEELRGRHYVSLTFHLLALAAVGTGVYWGVERLTEDPWLSLCAAAAAAPVVTWGFYLAVEVSDEGLL